jgi:hypothetical protein
MTPRVPFGTLIGRQSEIYLFIMEFYEFEECFGLLEGL